MSSLFFWKEWSRSYRLLYLGSLVLVLISLVLFLMAWARGIGNVVSWNILSELNDLPVTLHTFTDGLLDFSVPGTAYAVSEQFVTSAMRVEPGMAAALLVGICITFVLLLSALTRFDRTRYLVGMGMLILGLAFFRFEMLEVPGLGSNGLFLVLAIIFGSVSYYFHAFRSEIRISVRLAVFGGLVAMVVAVLAALSPVAHPAMVIVSYGMPVLLAYSVGFIFFIAAEIVAGLVWLTTASRASITGGTSAGSPLGLRNFLFISALYFVNLILIWLKNTKAVDWDVLIISPFILFLVSVIIGFWGFRRLVQQQNVVSFRDGGSFLYVGFALLSTLTITYAFVTANDPIIEVFEDLIVYSHLAMGIVFVAYVLINFLPIFKDGRAVHRILYIPKRLELGIFRVIGLFLVVVLVSVGGSIVVRQTLAGYNNGLGDLYVANGELASAQAFYGQALEQEFQNHKSNYALASLAMQRNDQPLAAYFFRQATLKQPQPHDYAGLSQTYLQTDLFFEAIKTLQQGLRAFPKSGELQNNLGYLYARTSIADSAYYYLKAATNNASHGEVPMTNLLSLYARNPNVLTADSSLAQNTTETTYTPYQANALALQLTAPAYFSAREPVRPAALAGLDSSSALNVGNFAGLYNFALASQHPNLTDTTLTETLRQLANNPANQDFTDDLLLARAIAEYHRHNHPTAFGLLSQVVEGNPQKAIQYRTITGLLLMEQGLYRTAADQFSENSDTTSIYYRALTLTKTGNPAMAQSLWETAAKTDPNIARLSQALYGQRPLPTDLERAFKLMYDAGLSSTEQINLYQTITNPNTRAVAAGTLARQLFSESDTSKQARKWVSLIPKEGITDPYPVSVARLARIKNALTFGPLSTAETLLNQPMLDNFRAEQTLLRAGVYQTAKDQSQPPTVRKLYDEAVQLAPLDARIVAAAARFYQEQRQIQSAYSIVLTALPFNETSPDLLKMYVTLCLDQSLFDYARDGLARLQLVTPPADYQAFVSAYQEKLASVEKSREKFSQ